MRITTVTLSLSLLVTALFAGGSAYANDLDPNQLNALLEREIREAQKANQDQGQSKAESSQGSGKTDGTKNESNETQVVNVLGRPSKEVSPEQYHEKVLRLAQILKQFDDPRGVLEAKVQEGTLSLTPNDIYTARLIDDAIEQAINTNIVSPKVLNLPYSIDVQNKFKSYDIFIHESGTTQIEFTDAKGNPWPIFNNSPASSFDVSKPTVNTLWVTPTHRYRNNNIFVTLEKYPNTIQLNLIYDATQRHGLASFSVPLLGPVSKPEKPKAEGVDLANPETYSGNGGDTADVALKISDIDQNELMYLAETGYFEPGSEAYKSAKTVVVNDRNIANIWFYKNKFIVRSPYSLDANWDNVINPNGVNKVYVAKNLNSIVKFYSGSNEFELILPDYHRYRSGW
ncbi:hypothetical protein G6355_11040 [Vibrio cholerae]|uniref:Uncharacterized protein n=1 Tax=Vibrio cholerae TaxID=666 RepID=A0ABD7SRC0_VIBCL|nr:DotH/IcmK family type IV secretion protein [Vibrio cholerae]KFE28922.1 hypothetical protein DN30_543 [Vibrio cholerae]TXX67380.1 hypothetical protein FXF03_02035 [Vibrio cholerae]TXY44145.1 hypothetical protein FXE84_02025 [Vibrio cholerae]GIB00292.1 hypothetical protein VCSRO136_2563 [Vibrio cholerae]HAU9839186.1 hypothetical protein [Vibrio cholerae O1]